jgi:hypothetical protein
MDYTFNTWKVGCGYSENNGARKERKSEKHFLSPTKEMGAKPQILVSIS